MGVNTESLLVFLPIVYLVSYTLLFRYANKNNKYRISVFIILALYWVRMVFLPAYEVFNGYYSRPFSYSDNDAILLCCYECIVVTVTLIILSSRQNKIVLSDTYDLRLSGSASLYGVFILFAVAVYLLLGRHLSMFEFGIKAIGEGIEREGDITDGRALIVRQIVSSGYLFLYFVLVSSFKNKFDISHKQYYLNISLLISAMMVCIIIGERRSSQIYIAFSCIWLLSLLYPQHNKKVISWVGIAAALVLVTMTIYKQFNAFLYNSYGEALRNSSLNEGMSVGMVDAYFNGINTVKRNLDFAHNSNLTFSNFIYDIFRSIFGIHFFFKDGLLTSELYNLQIYGGEQSTGYLLSSVGYGYLYFGPIFAPILTVVNVLIVCFLEVRMRKARSIEMSYIWAYIFMRFAYGCLLAIPPLINSASRYLIINGLIVLIASQRPSTTKH